MSLTKVSYSMINGEVANVLDFGAGPDKTAAENTAAFDAAIASGATNIFFPEGSYSYIPPLKIDVDSIILQGANGFSTKLIPTAVSSEVAVQVGVFQNVSSFTIQNIEIYGNSSLATGLYLGNSSGTKYAVNINVIDCYIHGFTNGSGITLDRTWWINITQNTTISYCKDGIYIPPLSSVTTFLMTESSKINNCSRYGVNNSSTNYTDQFVFDSADISTCGISAIYSTAPQWVAVINNCYFEDNGTDPAALGAIYITSSKAYPANPYDFASVRMDGNQFHTTLNGPDVYLGIARKSVVKNNRGLNTISTASETDCYFENNQGNGAGDPLALYTGLLGAINAYEYEPAVGKWRNYSSSSFGWYDTHLSTVQTTAPTVAFAAGQGTNATVSLTSNSTDIAGQVVITTTGVTNLSPLFELTFNKAYTAAPVVILTPASSAAQVVNISNQVGVAASTAKFSAEVTSTFTTSGVTLKWNYVVIGIES